MEISRLLFFSYVLFEYEQEILATINTTIGKIIFATVLFHSTLVKKK